MGNFLTRFGDFGRLLFGVWLLLTGLSHALNFSNMTGLGVILGLILIGSGVCFIIGR
jgi:hypothetical protein